MKKRKWYSLIDKIWSLSNLEDAFSKVKENRGAGGIDGVSITQFEAQKQQNLLEIQRLLRSKQYKVIPVRRVEIPKPDGNYRPLGIPTVRDRVVQQATLNKLDPIFETKFLDCSYGFRKGRNAHQAVVKVEQYRDEGCEWVVEADIDSFFDSVDHELLIDQVAEEISDGSVLRLIRSWLEAGAFKGIELIETNIGTPQGGVISPLLANIYLHPFDVQMTALGFKLVRYADDFVIMCKTEEEANRALKTVKQILAEMKLRVKVSKTRIVQSSKEEGTEFLGFKIFKEHKVPRKGAVMKFKDKVRAITRRQQPTNVKQVIRRLNPVIRGWGNYFKIANVNWLFKGLDSWIRMRLRSFIEKKKSYNANWRISNQYFIELRFHTLSSLIGY
ncbi:MAG: group II intron reverse transcriptase/maturase [Thaumarchaeota archaeon]|nr:group II intron reverse transcriptase/maturase [Nitrososphaerota archaeon]